MTVQPKSIIADAVVRKDVSSKDKLLDKAFAFAFNGLGYALLWVVPLGEMECLAI